MQRISRIVFQCVIAILSLALLDNGQLVAQPCDPTTPTFTIDLTGNADSVWTSTSVARDGFCCSASGSDRCIEFNLTLDADANGIQIDIISGTVPASLDYELDCGTTYSIGSPACISGVGPHRITFCQPGSSSNEYRITSIPNPNLTGSAIVSESCNGLLVVQGLDESTITWQSIPFSTFYNSFLSCTSLCDSVTVSPSEPLPTSVQYRVGGSVLGGCGAATFVDTITVRFVPSLEVTVTPETPTVCFGSTTTALTATASGGVTPYTYSWNTGPSTPAINVGAGTHIVTVTDSTGCISVTDTATVTAFSSAIQASAGSDTVICASPGTIQLDGSVQAASGGHWVTGSGTFSPDSTSLNATYTLSPSEITNGSVELILVTTGNGSCAADSDTVIVTVKPNPTPVISGPDTACAYRTTDHSVPVTNGHTYAWVASGGSIVGRSDTSFVEVLWGSSGSGSITITETDTLGCDSTVSQPIDIKNTPAPVISGPDTACEYRSTVYSVPSVSGNSYQWSAIGGTINGSDSSAIATVIWGPLGAGSVSVTQSNSSGCDSSISLNVDIKATPTPVIMGPDSACEYRTSTFSVANVSSDTYQWIVTGGTIVGSDVLDSVVIDWGMAGVGLVSVVETSVSGCDSSVFKFIDINSTPTPVITGPDSACEYQTSTHSITGAPGDTYRWVATGGTIIGSDSSTSVVIDWGTTGTGYISLTETNTSGCDSVMLDTVTILPTPVPVITSGLDTVCEYSSNSYVAPSVAGDTYQWSVTGGSVIGTATSNTVHISWAATGTGIVTLTQTNPEGCDSTIRDTIVIQPTPVPVFLGDDSVCAYSVTPISVVPTAGYSYNWSVTGGTIVGPDTTGDIFVRWGPDGFGQVIVTLTNPEGCDSTDILPIVIHPTPIPVIMGSDSVCELRSQTYSVTPQSGHTYQWTVTGGTITTSDTSSSIDVLWGATGQGIVTVTQTSDFNCDSTVTDTIDIHPTPRPVIFGRTDVCANYNFTYNTSVNPTYTYQWVATGGTVLGDPTNDTVQVRWGVMGVGALQLTSTNSWGCDSTVSINTTINPTPEPVIFGPDSVCEFNTAAYQAPFFAGDRYQWSVVGGSVVGLDTLDNVTVKWDAAGVGTVTLTQINVFDCDSTVSFQSIIKPKPTPVITGPTVVCELRSNTYSITPEAGSSYQWIVTGGTIQGSSTGNSITVEWGVAGFRNIQVTHTNSLNCDSTISISVDVTRLPTPVVFGPGTSCSNQIATYATPLVGTDRYLWTASGGTIVGTDTASTVDIQWGAAGVGTVTITQTTLQGCDSVISSNVTINPTPNPDIIGPLRICEFSTATYQADGPVGEDYQWSINGGIILSADTGHTINVRWGAEGTGFLTLVHTNAFGCTDQVTGDVRIDATPRPQITGPTIGCEASGVTEYTTPPTVNTSYNWTVQNGTILSGQGTPTIRVRWDFRGAQQISLTQAHIVTGCDSTVTFNVTVDSVPQAVIQASSFTGCVPFDVDFTGNNTAPNISYSWSFGNNEFSSNPNPSVTYDGQGAFPVQLLASHPSGCTDTVTSVVQVFPVPDAAFDYSFRHGLLFTEDSLLLENQSSNADQFTWRFGDGDISTEQDPIQIYNAPGIYRIWLIATNPSNCLDSTSRLVEVFFRENLIAPTAFSPNGDGINDVFTVSSENLVKFSIVVYNRWGEIVFSSEDPNFVWDGTNQGQGGAKGFVEQGLYGYLIKAEGYHGKTFEVKESLLIFY